MDNTLYTGNSMLDKIIRGPYAPNPNYNPKTKKGKKQPKFLLDTSAGNISGGAYDNTVQGIKGIQFNSTDYGRSIEDIKRDEELGITFSPYNSDDDLNTARANGQSALTQFGNFLMQAGVGEIVLGTLEGFGNIVDGVVNTFTGDEYGVNPYTQYMHELKEEFNKNFEIYQKNPDESFQFNDFGWWMQNLVSAATTVSLMLPAAGWLKAAGLAGKLTGLSKLGNWSVGVVSKGLAKATSKGTKIGNIASEIPAVRTIAGKAGRIEKGIKDWGAIGTQAYFSRSGEGYMEAREVYNTIYQDSLDNLNGMDDKAFAEFLRLNKEFVKEDGTPMSKEDISKEIARNSANKTFFNDYWMLGMDILQFKALGSLFSGKIKSAPTARERLAFENQKRILAGKTEKDLIKDNLLNRAKVDLKYTLKSPTESLTALELGEGFEELFQGIQSEKGMEVATQYFNPNFTPRTLSSYLTDPKIWEQFMWGSIAAVGFNHAYKGVQHLSHNAQGLYNKKHMSAEEYERWKRSEDKIRIEQINNTINRTNELINNIQQINEGRNPFNFNFDENNQRVIIKNGDVVNETITEAQKELLKKHAVRKFVDESAMDSTDNGTFELMYDLLNSNEFNKYIADKGLNLTKEDAKLNQEILDRLNAVNGIYTKELTNVANHADTTNPYITIAAARDITRHKLKSEEYGLQLDRINMQLAEANDTNTDYSGYIEHATYREILKQIDYLNQKRQNIEEMYKNNEIGRSARDMYIETIDKDVKELLNYAATNTKQGAFDSVRQMLKENKDAEQILDEFDRFIDTYNTLNREDDAIPPSSVRSLIDQKIGVEINDTYNRANTPITEQDYKNTYDEFGVSMDQILVAKSNDYIDIVKSYLRGAKDLKKAIDKIYTENTGNEKVDEALHFLKFGYQVQSESAEKRKGQMLINFQLDSLIEGIKKEREENKKVKEEADKLGVELPLGEEGNVEQEEDEVKDEESSTGEEPQTKPIIPAPAATPTPVPAPAPVATPNDEQETSALTEQNENQPESVGDEVAVLDDTGEDEVIDNDAVTALSGEEEKIEYSDEEKEAMDIVAESYATDDLKASIAASRFIAETGFNEPHIFDEITEAEARGDNSKKEAYINKVVQFLKEKGYNEEFARIIANQSFINTINNFAAMKSKPVFARLAQQLALGTSEKLSSTELASEDAIDKVVDEFLKQYIEEVKGLDIGGKFVINLQSLFDYIFENTNVDKLTAYHIYNNLGKFISKNDESKYVFTGFDTSRALPTSDEFFNRVAQEKSIIKSHISETHLHLVEERDKDFEEAMLAAANGAPTFIKTGGSVFVDFDTDEKELEKDENGNNVPSHLDVYVTIGKGKKKRDVKIGILRTVEVSENLDHIFPTTHWSGFYNVIHKTNNGYRMSTDNLFEAIINQNDADAKQLFQDLANYTLQLKQLADSLTKSGLRGNKWATAFRKGKEKIMTRELAKSIYENKYIQYQIVNELYRFYDKNNAEIVKRAETIATTISNILFYGQTFESSDAINASINTLSFNKDDMLENYEDYKEKVYDNYKKTYEYQKSLSDAKGKKDDKGNQIAKGDVKVEISINVPYTVALNQIPNSEDYVNVADADFELDSTSKSTRRPYTPLVMVMDGQYKDESGKVIGPANRDMGKYSMGFLVSTENGVNLVAHCINKQSIKNTPIAANLRKELANILKKQLDNTNSDTHDAVFNELVDRLKSLFGFGGLFKANNIRVVSDKDNNFVSVQKIMKDGSKINLITLYKNNKNNTIGNSIGVYSLKTNNLVTSTDVSKGGKTSRANGNVSLTAEEYRSAINYVINGIINESFLNSSKYAMDENITNPIFRRENGKFIVNLGGTDTVYENYGDFIVQNRGFTTNVKRTNGEFVIRTMRLKGVTISGKVRDTSDDMEHNNNVTDLVQSAKGKIVKTEAVLEAAGVPQDKIDILMGTNSGFPICNKNIYISDSKEEGVRAYYANRHINVTNQGFTEMNGNPVNAIRLILHENIHRHFAQHPYKERVIAELNEVYEYVKKQFEQDLQNPDLQRVYGNLKRIFDAINSYEDDDTIAEEFLAESLSQPLLVKYLNNTTYTESESLISNIPQKSKTIFQKIIDLLLKLFNIGADNIKNNSILAREYIILSDADVSTDGGLFKKPVSSKPVTSESAKKDGNTSPVKEQPSQTTKPTVNTSTLAATKKKIDNLRANFDRRIKRSGNFAEDHTYFIDGKPADTSVTQQIHNGEKLEEQWGIPSSILGNTADDAARMYFNEQRHIFDDGSIPNVVHEEDVGLGIQSTNSDLHLKKEIAKIEKYLDDRFGKGRYGVITEEFPIGGVVVVNGQEKTIAGTMDMLVYTDTGDIYIFDFKTKRIGDNNGNFDEETLIGYRQQLNVYRQILEANNPDLKGKIKLGGLIKFNVNYPAPSKNFEYRKNPDDKTQLQVKEKDGDFVNIQDSLVNYTAPFFANDLNNPDTVVPAEVKDYVYEIKSLPIENNNSDNESNVDFTNGDIAGSDMMNDEENVIVEEEDEYDDFDEDEDFNPVGRKHAKSELVDANEISSLTPTEIYAPAVADGITDNTYGVRVVNDINDFVNSFPSAYRENIQQILASNELNFTCK